MKNKRTTLLMLVLKVWTTCIPKVVVHFSYLFGNFSLLGWLDYEGMLLFLMSFSSVLMY